MMPVLLDSFEVLVSWYQIIVHDERHQTSYNDWRPEHVRQGFAWRDGSVSFATIDILPASVEVWLARSAELCTGTLRAVRVPFRVTKQSVISVCASFSARVIDIPPADYSLIYEHGLGASGKVLWCRFTFVPDASLQAEILVCDAELSPPSPLCMIAEPV